MDRPPTDKGKGTEGENTKKKEHKRIKQEKLDSHHKARRNTRHNTEEKKYANLEADLSSNDVLEILRGFHWHAQQTPQDPMELINQLRPSSEEDLTAGDSDDTTWRLKINKLNKLLASNYFFKSGSGDLNEDEKHLRADELVGRIERDERKKRALTRKLDNLHKDYTTAMHIVYTSMYVASQIYHLVQFGKELYKDNPEVLARFAEKPLVKIAWHVAQDMNERTGGTEYQDKYDRWVDHYKLNLVLTSLSHKLKANPDSHLSHLPRFIMNDAGKLIPLPVPVLVPPPLLGPIEIYNGRRSHLMSEIAAHNYTNEKYNQKYPHLDDNFKLGTFDDEGKLTPDIPHLPSLEDALKEKTWEEYKEKFKFVSSQKSGADQLVDTEQKPLDESSSANLPPIIEKIQKFRLCPVELPEDIENIGNAFSQGSVEWCWDGKDEKYELIYYE